MATAGRCSASSCPPTAARRQPPACPTGPNIQEHRGGIAPVRTYEDLLASAHDEALFDYYATSQLAFVDAASGQRTTVGTPAVFDTAEPSPDGQFILVRRVRHPYSWLVPYRNFPASVEVWNRQGAAVKQIAQLPVADNVPNGGVMPGPRSFQWQPLAPATVVWAEALDNGDPKNKVPHRDKVMTMSAPFTAAPSEMTRTEYRVGNVSWTDAGAVLLTENDRGRRWTRTWVIDKPGATPRKLWDRSQEDSYGNPGTPQRHDGASGVSTIQQNANSIFLAGTGAAPEGARPFIDRLDLTTLKSERLFQTTGRSYETVIGVLSDDGSKILTRYESRTDPPNVYVRDLKAGTRRALTSYADPAPQLKGIQKQLVTYKRSDGVELSATIITPPGWTPAQGPLPTLLWAYPREFTDPTNAGQVTGSADRYTSIGGASHLLFLTQGYAIIDDPTMPIVGPGETANDTYIPQLVASAQAAVDRAVSLGVTDRNRVVAGGHSYGGFMTANLLAHSDIFRAGLARSGAYNRTLTPFGFQNEQRTFWEVPQIYAAMSPFYFAHKINEPILLIHGEADDNSGTFPIQSERLYMALKGNGATVRYVTLPFEAHGYAARESVLHTVAEMLNWANEFAKNAKPRTTTSVQHRVTDRSDDPSAEIDRNRRAALAVSTSAFADVTVKSIGGGKGMGITGSMATITYIKGNKMRTDTVTGDTTRTMIFDVDNQRLYSFDSKKKEADCLEHAGVCRRQMSKSIDHVRHEGDRSSRTARPRRSPARPPTATTFDRGARHDGRAKRHEDDGDDERPDVGREGRARHRGVPGVLQRRGGEGLDLQRSARRQGLARARPRRWRKCTSSCSRPAAFRTRPSSP